MLLIKNEGETERPLIILKIIITSTLLERANGFGALMAQLERKIKLLKILNTFQNINCYN